MSSLTAEGSPQASGKRGPLEFSFADLVASRLAQIYVYARDLSQTTGPQRRIKRVALRKLTQGTSEWLAEADSLPYLSAPDLLRVDDGLVQRVAVALRNHRRQITQEMASAILLEALVSVEWPKGVDWEAARPEVLARAAVLLGASVSEGALIALGKSHKRAVKRLRKDSMATGVQVAFGSLMVGVAVLTGGAGNTAGPLAQAVGTAIGNSAGLYGAAATSYGLAVLGGGSLAAGGYGMAGGAFLLYAATQATRSVGTKVVATVIAQRSPASFMHELAKLDVRCQLDPDLAPRVISGLRALKSNLEGSLEENRTSESTGWLPPKERRNLAACVRATDFEIRHLSSSSWKRGAARVSRLIGMPSLSKLLDRFE